jgi:hypothetical protein
VYIPFSWLLVCCFKFSFNFKVLDQRCALTTLDRLPNGIAPTCWLELAMNSTLLVDVAGWLVTIYSVWHISLPAFTRNLVYTQLGFCIPAANANLLA